MSVADWLSPVDAGVRIEVRVTPKAGRNAIGSVEAGRLKLQVTAAPEGGKANDAVRKLVAKKLGVGKTSVEVARGETSRDKSLLISGVSIATAISELGG